MLYMLILLSDSLKESVFPVFTMYGEKVCLAARVAVCPAPWTLEVVPGWVLRKHYEVGLASSHLECFTRCLESTSHKCRLGCSEALDLRNRHSL